MITLTEDAMSTYITKTIKDWEHKLFDIPVSENTTTVEVINSSPKGIAKFLSIKDGILGHTRRFKINQRDRTTIATINEIDSDGIQYLSHPTIKLRELEPFNIEKLNIPAIALKNKKQCEQLRNELITIVTIWAIDDVIKYRSYDADAGASVPVPPDKVLQSTRITNAIQSCFYRPQALIKYAYEGDPDGYSRLKHIATITIYGGYLSNDIDTILKHHNELFELDSYEIWFNSTLRDTDEIYIPSNVESKFVTHIRKITTNHPRETKIDTMIVMAAMLLKFRTHNWVFDITK